MAKKIKQLTGKYSDFSGIVLKAAARGDMRAVRHYSKKNPNWLNEEGPHGRTLLWEAVYKNRTEAVRELIELGANVRVIASYYTPMLVDLSAFAVARQKGNDELVALLKKHGAKDDFYASCHRGDEASMMKTIKRNPKIVNKPIWPKPHRPRGGCYPVHYAVAGQQVAALKLLVKQGAQLATHVRLLTDWADENKEMIAFIRKQAKKENPKLKLPEQEDAEKHPGIPAIDRPNPWGFPPLVDESRGNHNATDDPSRIKPLLDQGANVNAVDHKGCTALHRAAQAGFVRITQLLIDHGANVEAKNNQEATPLFEAASRGRFKAVELLLKNKASVRAENRARETALFAAARAGNIEIVKLLIKRKSKTSHKNANGETAVDVLSRLRKSDSRNEVLTWLKKNKA